MTILTISWQKGRVKLIDQTKLPQRLEYLYCRDTRSLVRAIESLKIRGAPALGVAAGFGVVLGIQNCKSKDFIRFKNKLDGTIKLLRQSRPTAVNLFWALERMREVALRNKDKPVSTIKRILLKEAKKIQREDISICRRLARYGSRLIKDQDVILTICNAGALACAGLGTALGVIYRAKEEGKRIKVITCETRPLLQGARLTTWELKKAGIDHRLICDNMAACLMREGRINKILVGADRIALNGDTANKVGTYNLACLAKFHNIPFFVAAPSSTFDLNLKTGKEIPIEQRSQAEVVRPFGKWIAPRGVAVYNPAFDVTPNRLITAIITERGIIRPPYKKAIKALFGSG
jgi:methylthioribose-1-phosphate isomerase